MDLFDVLAPFLPMIPTIALEPRLGNGSHGPIYGPPVAVRAVVEQKRRLVRDATGSEVVSETTLFVAFDTTCPDGSRVRLPDGQATTVIVVSRHDSHGQDAIPAHLEIACQ